MLSQFERYAFVGDLKVFTYRNYFKDAVPTGLELFTALKQKFDKGETYSLTLAPRTFLLHSFSISNSGFAELLFHMIDPSIPDNVLKDRKSNALRKNKRKPNEDPAVSAHFVVNLNAKFDSVRSYPTCIENIDYLPKTMMVSFLNHWMAAKLREERTRPQEKIPKIWQPKLDFIAPASQTIQGALNSGGALTGVKWVDEKMVENAFGDDAYPVHSRKEVVLTVENKPRKNAGIEVLKSIWGKIKESHPSNLKVIIEDSHGRSKTIGTDPQKSNVLSNIFIPQEHFTGFSTPLEMCESSLRTDLVAKMKDTIK